MAQVALGIGSLRAVCMLRDHKWESVFKHSSPCALENKTYVLYVYSKWGFESYILG